jgi:hypothetical protein
VSVTHMRSVPKQNSPVSTMYTIWRSSKLVSSRLGFKVADSVGDDARQYTASKLIVSLQGAFSSWCECDICARVVCRGLGHHWGGIAFGAPPMCV